MTLNEIAEKTVNTLEPSLLRNIETYADATHPELIIGREALQRRYERLTGIVLNALKEAVSIQPVSVDSVQHRLVTSMARTLWVNAWMDWAQEFKPELVNKPGEDLMDLAPETPRNAWDHAMMLLGRILQANPATSAGSPIVFVSFAWRLDGNEGSDYSQRFIDQFGHYLVMMALGHGVSWFDDHEFPGLEVPGICCPDISELVDEWVGSEYEAAWEQREKNDDDSAPTT